MAVDTLLVRVLSLMGSAWAGLGWGRVRQIGNSVERSIRPYGTAEIAICSLIVDIHLMTCTAGPRRYVAWAQIFEGHNDGGKVC